MKAKELRMKSSEELEKQLQDLREQLFSLKFQKVVGRLENPNLIRGIRRDMARIKTLLAEQKA
jgi:large subunit ribosomal protein L29